MVSIDYNKIIKLFLFTFFLFYFSPATGLHAQTMTSTTGTFKIIKKGEISPIDGIVYDMLGNAIILADKEQAEKKCEIVLEEQKERLEALMERQNNLNKIRLETSQKIFDSTLSIKNKEIKEIREIAINGGDKAMWWAIGGIALGVSISLVTVGFMSWVR